MNLARRLDYRVLLLSAVLCAGTAGAGDVPAVLAPPAGAKLLGLYTAKGVQIYVCAPKGTAAEWAFKAPEAALFDAGGAAFAKHYAGPTWEAPDGSKVVGKVLRTVPSPTPGAVPWLLLSAISSGQGVLAGVDFVQRLETAGGAGPAGACPTPGAEQRIPYAATYVFYK